MTLRPATLADSARLLAWRNHPGTREGSLSSAPVGRREHVSWLRATLAKDSIRLYVVEAPAKGVEGGPIGTGRLDLQNKTTVELSMTIDPDWRGHGYGTPVLAALIAQVRMDFPDVRQLRARVRVENVASFRVVEHQHVKFVPQTLKDGVVELTATLDGIDC